METGSFAGLSGVRDGGTGGRAPLVLLHGLTFDHTMWRPVLAAVHETDPGRQALALDLPGHGGSPPWPRYGIDSLAAAVHEAVTEARLRDPVVVGHSMGAMIATAYAARYPASGVVNVDQWLQVQSVAALAKPLAGKIRGTISPRRGSRSRRACTWSCFPRRRGSCCAPPAACARTSSPGTGANCSTRRCPSSPPASRPRSPACAARPSPTCSSPGTRSNPGTGAG